MRPTLMLLLVAAAALVPLASRAATPAQLFALRDAAVQGACAPAGDSSLGPISASALGADARLYVVPCRTTFADVLSVVVLEHAGALRAVVFPDPGAAFGKTWEDARMNRIGVTSLLPSPGLAPSGELVASLRIAPGVGAGHVVQRYVFEDGTPVLTRFSIERDGRPPIVLWSAP